MEKLHILCLIIVTGTISVYGQSETVEGKYEYSIIETPYGDFFGNIFLTKDGRKYKGEIINEEGVKFYMKAIVVKGNEVTFKTNLEETKSVFTGHITADSIRGSLKVSGDDFHFILKGKRISDGDQ